MTYRGYRYGLFCRNADGTVEHRELTVEVPDGAHPDPVLRRQIAEGGLDVTTMHVIEQWTFTYDPPD